jgi:hypothetical protein
MEHLNLREQFYFDNDVGHSKWHWYPCLFSDVRQSLRRKLQAFSSLSSNKDSILWSPVTILSDYEEASTNAFRSVLPSAPILWGRLPFHASQRTFYEE